ncbi:MAG: MFS transporter [Anaerolineae bacterium]|jgi:MFS family permease/protein-S-isoprenylcysteine O-methyltransferase Ste14
MSLDALERCFRAVGLVALGASLALVVAGLIVAARRPRGRAGGRAAEALGWPAYLIIGAGFFGACILLWRPIPVCPSPSWRAVALVLGGLLLVGGLVLYLWARLALGSLFDVSSALGARLYAGHRLVSHGPFALVRHPMYLGLISVAWGGLFLYRTWTFLFLALTFPGLALRARREEEVLAAEFGPAWHDYGRRVPGWLPRPIWRRGDERADADRTPFLKPEQVRLLLPLGAGVAFSLAGDSTLYAVLANEVAAVGIGLGAVGILLGANRLIRIPGNPLAGALYDRLGRRPLFLLGLLLGVLSTAAYGWVRGFGPMLAARLLWGTAWALINVGGYTMVMDRSTAADRGRMTGLYQISYMVGLSVSPIVGGGLTDALGFRPAVRICAVIQAVGLLVALLGLPETRAPGAAMPAAGRPAPGAWLRSLAASLGHLDRQMLAVAFVYLSIFFVSNGVLMSTISLYLGQRWGDRVPLGAATVGVASLAGVMLSTRATLGIVAGPLAGTISDRLSSRWPVVYAGLVLAVAGFVVMALPLSVWAVLVGVGLVASGTGALIAVLAALVGDRVAGSRPGAAMGALATAGDIGSATGPLVAYGLAAHLDLRWVYLACLGVLLLAGLAVRAGRKTRS